MLPPSPPLGASPHPAVSGVRQDAPPFLSTALSYLAFENPALRVCLELVTVTSLFFALRLTTAHLLGADGPYVSLYAWFAAAGFVAIFDLQVFLLPLFRFRQAQLFALAGAFGQAIQALDEVGPTSPHRVRCPRPLYHLRRAQILMFQGEFVGAFLEAQLAQQAGLPEERATQLRIEINRIKGDFEATERELHEARTATPQSAALAFEEGLLLLTKREDLRRAARCFQEVQNLPGALHWSGAELSFLAQPFTHACNLWTGRAEEALPRLSRSLDQLTPLAAENESLRFHTALLLVERGYYLATHSEPLLAVSDVRSLLRLCSYPAIIVGVRRIEEELSWRYKIRSSLQAEGTDLPPR